jgi:hypothetical protein
MAYIQYIDTRTNHSHGLSISDAADVLLGNDMNRDLGSDKERNQKGYLSLESYDGQSVKGLL